MDKVIFFTTLVLFPFGQIFKFGIFNFFDITVLLLAIVTLFKKPKYPNWYKYFVYFLLFCVFGLLLNSSLFTVRGLLYLVRLWSYSMIAVYLFNNQKIHLTLNLQLLAISAASAVLGWIQYLIWPDLTTLKYLNWDDHLLRMVGTFLDPTFLGLILVLGIILALKQKNNLAFYFLGLTILFTYSRISYLLLFLITFLNKKYFAIFLFIFIILLLPRNIGEGTNLGRTTSGVNKLINYTETIEIIKKSPLYGIGFNNMCPARLYYLNVSNTDSHACNGSDSSILFILATAGIIGFSMLVYAISRMPYGLILKTSFVVVLIHSLFTNSLFYPHIMFWLFCLIGLQREADSN